MTKTSFSFTTRVDVDVQVGRGILADLPARLRSLQLGPQVAIITDETVNRLYGRDVERSLRADGFIIDTVELPVGEQCKSLATLGKVLGMLQAARVDRTAVIIALGGGVIGDVAGLVAATWQRGLQLVQVPTTLFSQADGAVGGRASINHLGLKNLLGIYKHPRLVLADPILLDTLRKEQYIAGLAEVVKTALLAGPEFWYYLVQEQAGLLRHDPVVLAEVIGRCLTYKAATVARDPEDLAERRALNLGHALGGAIEELAGQEYSHGQAVSIGLCFALELSLALGLPQAVWQQARQMLQGFGLPTSAPGLDLADLLRALHPDGQLFGGGARWVLLQNLGQPLVTGDLPAGWQDILARLVERK